MKNKKWKREAKRLKGVANRNLDCFSCNLHGTECYSACLRTLRKLELNIKKNNIKKSLTSDIKDKYNVSIYKRDFNCNDSSENIIFNDYLTEEELNDILNTIECNGEKNRYTEVCYYENMCTVYIDE